MKEKSLVKFNDLQFEKKTNKTLMYGKCMNGNNNNNNNTHIK